MTTHMITTHTDPCLDCDQVDGVPLRGQHPDTDTWACRHPVDHHRPHPRGGVMPHRPRRILVTGSRTWTDQAAIARAITDYLRSIGTSIGPAWPLPIIVHGGARGADQLADAIARGWGWTPERHPADWARYGRAAGYRRNAAMVALGAEVCLAFILDGSAGASHTAGLAQAAGIPTRHYRRTTTPGTASATSDGRSVRTGGDDASRGGAGGCCPRLRVIGPQWRDQR